MSSPYFKTISRTLFAAFIGTFLAAEVSAAPDPYGEYLAKHRCQVADRLQRVFEAGDPSIERDRYLIIAVSARDQSYVQCLFHDNNTMVFCEAASGFYFSKPHTPRTMWLRPEKVAALARLGFSTDDKDGNFALDIPFEQPPDFGSLADLMLKALYVGYDARVDQAIEYVAPFAPTQTSSCDPTA